MRYFTGTVSQLGGIDLETIVEEANKRHQAAIDSTEGSSRFR